VLTPDGDGAWFYLICTVPFWLAARGVAVGVAVLIGAVALEALAVRVSGVRLDGGNWMIFALHVVQVAATTAYAALLVRMARRGFVAARTESRRAGRELERLQVLARLQRRVQRTWQAIAVLPQGMDAGERLDRVRVLATATVAELRAALRDAPPESGPSELAAGLGRVAAESRTNGLAVELVVTELTGDPPRPVTGALVAATRLSLQERTARSVRGRVVVRVTGSPERTEVCLRDAAPGGGPGGEALAVLASVGARAEVRELNRGTRTRMLWSPP
jgi:hypothetical protein